MNAKNNSQTGGDRRGLDSDFRLILRAVSQHHFSFIAKIRRPSREPQQQKSEPPDRKSGFGARETEAPIGSLLRFFL